MRNQCLSTPFDFWASNDDGPFHFCHVGNEWNFKILPIIYKATYGCFCKKAIICFKLITNSSITFETAIVHSFAHGNMHIDVIIDSHLFFTIKISMQASSILSNYSFPRNWRCKNKVSSRGQSKPSPTYLPVATSTIGSEAGMLCNSSCL